MTSRTLMLGVSALILGSAAAATMTRATSSEATEPHRLVTRAEYERWQAELSNWGRWGKDDEMGTLNLVTAAKRKQAAALVKEGLAVSLSQDESAEKSIDNPSPIEWEMLTATQNGATDRVGWSAIHGPGHTHLDSFAHVFFNGKMWNGYPVSELVTKAGGAARNSILTMKNGIVTRGVLYDLPRLKGVAFLEPGTRVFPEDLEAWEKKTGVKVGPGDALLFRWGRWTRRDQLGPFNANLESAGLDNSVIPWLKKRDVALLGWETPDYAPKPAGDIAASSLHNMVLTILGVHILDRANFDRLAEAAAARNRWDFMLTVAPLAIPHGTGSPVNPIAMF
jgi:kynurenine formamidase